MFEYNVEWWYDTEKNNRHIHEIISIDDEGVLARYKNILRDTIRTEYGFFNKRNGRFSYRLVRCGSSKPVFKEGKCSISSAGEIIFG